MTAIQERLIAAARQRHGAIEPCAERASLEECFTIERGFLRFWYNDPSGSTRMLSVALPREGLSVSLAGGGIPTSLLAARRLLEAGQ